MRRSDGFTVLEVMIAAFLLIAAVVSTASLMMLASSQGAVGKRATDATALAQQDIEQVRDMKYGDMANATHSTVVGSDTFTVTRTVTPNDPEQNMKRVHVAVTWNGGQRYDTETIFSDLSP